MADGLADGLGSFVAVYLVAAFLPGILANFIVVQLTVFKQRSPFFFTTNALLLGLIAYGAYGFVQWLESLARGWPGERPTLAVVAILNGEAPSLDFQEIGVTTALAVVVGVVTSVAVNRKWMHKMAGRLRLTKGLGDLNIWSHVFNSGITGAQDAVWIRARNARAGLYYDGWVQNFSDHSGSDELLLRDVWLYDNETGKPVYSTPAVYLRLNTDDWTVEFPMAPATDHMKRFGPEGTGTEDKEHGKQATEQSTE